MSDYMGVRDRVSMVTPVYNAERFLHRLLRSVLAQTWDHMEVILVDDGSSDRSVEAALAFQEAFRARGFRFQVVRGEHRNASAAISRGLPLVTGEFLIWPDSDDALEPDSVRRRVEFLRANPQYQCVRSMSRYLYEDGTPAPRQEAMGCPEDDKLFFPILMSKSFVCCGCYMLRCEPFFSIYPQRRIPEYDVGQNYQMLLPFMYRHPCPTIQEDLYTVYVREDSHSHRILTRREDEKKFADYESLVGELVSISGMSDPDDLLQVERWKWKRRRVLYLRYRRMWKAGLASLWLWRHGGIV